MKAPLAYAWDKAWRGRPPEGWLSLLTSVVAVVMTAPVAYVFVRAASADAERWARLFDTRVPALLWNTVSLTAVVAVATVFIGVALAWLVSRTDLPGRRVWRWLLAMPLAIPPYVGAMAYVIVLGPRGWVAERLGSTPVDMYSFGGVAFVLAAFTYPYVFLVTTAAFTRLGRAHEEAAQSLGARAPSVFFRVTLPMLRPAIGAGAMLVILYVLSDFGAIALLRFSTFTSAIYYQMGSYDTVSAAVLSVLLIVLTLVILGAEAASRRRSRYFQVGGVPGDPPVVSLGRLRWPALAAVTGVFVMSGGLPVGVLAYWTRLGIERGAVDARFLEFSANTFQVAALASVIAMVLSVPVAYLRSRHPAPASALIEKLAYSGYALPGVIIALGVIFFSIRYLPFIYNTMLLIAVACVIRFLPQSMQATSASLAQVSPRIDEAARISGLGPFAVMARVISRLVAPGLLVGGAMVFVSSAKELPATLLLRPAGFDTLAVRIWVEAGDGLYHLAAPAALVVIVLSLLPLKWMIGRY